MIQTRFEYGQDFVKVVVRIPSGHHWVASRALKPLRVIMVKAEVQNDDHGSWCVLEFLCEPIRRAKNVTNLHGA